MLKRFYQKYLRSIPAVRETVLLVKMHAKYQRGVYQKYASPTWHVEKGTKVKKVAVVCDKFTWTNLGTVVDTVYLSVHNWWDQMEQEKPELFFCEATWEGIDGCWSGEVFRNYEFSQDNRCVLKDILRYCREAGIETVFWNKEETPAFQDKPFSFIDTALLFDHIFTTAAECIPKYQALGHKSVHLMMFGYSPELFSVRNPRPGNGTAVFLGSWYAVHKERCEDMCRIFDMVLEHGMKLKIYDRVSDRGNADRQYPEKYAPYVLPGVPYERTGDIMNEADYVININSVKNSETMFARRVFEAMACGRIVISNSSVGMKKLFPKSVWYLGESFDGENEDSMIENNLEIVQTKYTFLAQLTAALSEINIQF